jgi:lysozyme
MKMSKKGLAALAKFEGLVKFMYKDVAGFPTIGVGHLLTKAELTTSALQLDGSFIDWRKGLSEAQCLALLAQDVYIFEQAVDGALVGIALTQHEFDACVSLAFNIGGAAFTGSSVVRFLRKGMRADAANAFLLWKKAGGKVVQGLLNRRIAEKKIFLEGIY